jgi:tape measure domain-containing protein
MSGVEIRVRSNSSQARRDLGKLEKSVLNIDKMAKKASNTFRNMAAGLAVAFTGNAFVRGINSASDSIATLENKLALVVGRGDELQGSLKALYGISARARMPIATAADTFNRFGLALKDSGKSTGELLKVTEAVAQAATVSGATAQSAEAAIVQLGQGLASGELRGQELNSVLEQMPRLARAIADGMKVPFGSLRSMAAEGKLNAEAVFAAIIDQAESIDKEFGTLEATIGGLTSVMKDEFTRALDALDVELGFSTAFKEQIEILTVVLRGFADNLYIFTNETKGQLRIFQNNVAFFAFGVKERFKDIFSFEQGVNLEALSKAFSDIKASFDANLSKLTTPISIKVKALDLSGYLPSLEAVKLTIGAFTTFIANLFETLYNAVVGDSWWGEIFWEGPNQIGGQKLTKALKAVTDIIGPWTTSIGEFFKALYTDVTAQWDKMVGYLNTSKIKTPAGEQVVISRFGRLAELMSTTGGAFIIDISNRAEKFFALEKMISTPGGDVAVPTTLGKFVDMIGNGFNFIEIKFSSNFEKIIESLKTVFDSAATFAIAKSQTPIKLGVTAAEGITDAFSTGEIAAKGFIKGITDSQDAIGAAIFAGFLIASKTGFKKFALGVTAVTFAPDILNSASFQATAKSLAKGFGEIITGMFTGEGDFGAQLAEGIGKSFTSIGAGLAEGLFGESFEGEFTSGFIGAAATAIAAVLVIGKLRTALIALGVKMGAALWAGSWLSEFATGFGLMLTDGLKRTTRAKKWKVAAGTLGMRLGAAVQVGLIAGLTVGLVVVLTKALRMSVDRVLKESFGFVGRLVTGESREQQSYSKSSKVYDRAMEGSADGAAFSIAKGSVDSVDLSTLGVTKLTAMLEAIESSPLSLIEQGKATMGLSTTVEEAADIIADAIMLSKSIFGANQDLPVKKANGGYISGGGTKTSDSIPAMLSKGEYVIRASAVDKFGAGFFNSLNSGIAPRRFNLGGFTSPFDDEIRTLAKDLKGLAEIGDKTALKKTEQVLSDLYASRRKYLAQNYSNVDLGVETPNVPKVDPDKDGKDKKQTAGQSFAEGFANDFRSGLTQALSTGDFETFGLMLLDSFTMSVIDSFSAGVTDAIFSNLIGSNGNDGPLAKVFTGVGDWAGGVVQKVGDTISKAFSGVDFGKLIGDGLKFITAMFGFNSGGIVPSTSYSQVGKDSVPAMLTPGEMVIPANKVGDFRSGNKSVSQVINLSITGDISRQTKQEIINMLPTIANGVNAQNKEANYRR